MNNILLIIIGFGGGVLEGAALASFITFLDLVPRLAQKSKSYNFVKFYQYMLVFSGISTTTLYFLNLNLEFGNLILIPIGLFFGVYVGILAAALAEVLNVVPVLERRLKLSKYIYIPLIAISLGKVIGSLIGWFFIIK